MAKPGRPSSASLSIVPPGPEVPPEPPAHLSEGAKLAWTEVFETVKPSQLAGGWHLVECYCTAVSLSRTYAQALETAPAGKVHDEIARSYRATAASVAMLARQLRLSPRSRVDKRVTLKVAPKGPRPWELPADDA